MKRFLTIFLLLAFTVTFAQVPTVYIKTLNTQDGLLSNNIKKIFQDSKGFMWFASANVMNRYDGYHFKTFVVDTNFHIEINALADINNKAGDLLIGTTAGLFRYDRIIQTIQPLKWWNQDTTLSRSDKRIITVYADSAYMYWLGAKNVLIKTDYRNKTIKKYNIKKILNFPSETNILVLSIEKDKKNNLWLGTDKGLYRLNLNSEQLTSEYDLPVHGTKITKIKLDYEGNLWMAVYNFGLVRFNPMQKTVKIIPIRNSISNGKYISGFICSDTDVWASFYENGLYRLDRKINTLVKYQSYDPNGSAFLSERLNTIYLDRNGLAWLGGSNTGVGRFNSRGINFYPYKIDGAKKLKLWSVYKDSDGYIWIGSLHKTILLQYNPKTNKIKKFPFSSSHKKNGIKKIIANDKTHLWVFTSKEGILRFHKQTGSFKKEKIVYGDRQQLERIQTAFMDSKKRIWISPIYGGLILFKPGTKETKYFPLHYVEKLKKRQLHIFSLTESPDHTIYMAGSKGKILTYDENTKSIKTEINFKKGSIRSILINKEGMVYFTSQIGFFEYNPATKKFHHYTLRDGFITDKLYCMLSDVYGNIWLSHGLGLSRFQYKTKKITNFNYLDGLANPIFSQGESYRATDGQLLFCNSDGITAFYPPKELSSAKLKDNIEISEVNIVPNNSNSDYKRLFYDAIYNGRSISLPYNSYIFMFDLFLTNFKSPNINRFQYKLEGLNRNWQNLGASHLITFLNLPSGAYTLHIKGKSYGGEWVEKKENIRFRIQTPFWLTWWFWSLVVLLFVSIGYFLFKLRIRAIRNRNKELEIINKQLNEQIIIRQQVEELLRTSESKYRTLVESIDEGILTIDHNGILYFLNNRAASYLNGLPEELSGRNIKQFLPTELLEDFMHTTVNVLKANTGQEISVEITRNEKPVYFHISFQPLKNEGDDKPLVLCVMAETTAQVELEEKLRQAQKMEAIGNLAGGVAHDFNNLLSVIRGYSFLLLKNTNATEDILASIHEIDEASERAQTLTRQLLAFSRKQLLKPKVLDLNQLITNLYKLLKRLIGENIQLKLELESDLKPVLADPGQMEQVLMNLVVNAKDAMPNGGQLLICTENISSEKELHAVRDPRAGSYIGIHVSDSGVGIEKKWLTKIFDPFFTTKETGKGTGLGLSTVFGIVKQSDGYILVESEPGQGSMFSIYLPQSEKVSDQEEEAQGEVVISDSNKTILVIEDENSVRSMISKMLKLYGYKSYIADSGNKGLQLFDLHKNEIDLILSDVVMPGMSGMEMVRILQKTAPDVPAIFMSGYTDDEIFQHGVKEDGIQFLQKPFDPDTLIRTIQKTINI